MKKIFMTLALLLTALQGMWATPTAQAVWVEGTKTLHFIYQETVVTTGSTFDGKTATEVWSGTDVTTTGANESPRWRDVDIMSSVTKVKFSDSFVNVKPTSFYNWFWGFDKVTEFEGLEYLNTSEATTMEGMFYACSSLKSIDVSTFDMGKVTNVSRMFWGCGKLKTIKSDKTWNYAADKSVDLFWSCGDLKGAKAYASSTASDYNANMANPVTGYFTMTDGTTMSGEGTAASPIQLSRAKEWEVVGNYVSAGKSTSGMYFQMTDNFVVKTMMGTSDHAFGGTFDGNNKLLYVDIDNGGNQYAAPFAFIQGATIKGVTVAGKVKGGNHSAGLVGSVKSGTNMVTDCYVKTEITANATGDDYFGGIVGHGQSSTLTVSGCVFNGELKKETSSGNSQYYGALVGWCDDNTNITVKDCFVDDKNPDFFNRAAFWRYSSGAMGTTNCYSTKTLNGATQVYEIDGAEDLVTLTPEKTNYPTTLTFYGTNTKAGGFRMRQVDEISTNEVNSEVIAAVVSDYEDEFYAAKDNVVKFTAPVASVTAKDADNNTVTVTKDGDIFSFTMPAKMVTLSTGKAAYAVWCSNNHTLYFTLSETAITEGGTYNNQTVSKVWSGDDVLNVGWGTPKWISGNSAIANDVDYVVIDASFADARPTSLFKWFCNMTDLKSIEGLTNLNTSEVTNMNSTFACCPLLETLDVDHFDVSKVTNATSMFYNSPKLKTIYCGKTWNISTADNMFFCSYSLVGAATYNSSDVGINMANPTTGYFTNYENKAYAIWCASNSTLYFTASDTPLNVGGTYQGHAITNVWSGTDVTNTGTGSNSPEWEKNVRGSVQHVVFDQSFSSIKPKSLAYWFRQMYYLEDITGLQYLNTSEATTTHTMFCETRKITTLDLTNFDMSNVKNATQMFYGCEKLTTIYCNNTWTVSSSNMFQNSTKLRGAVNYNSSDYSAAMANPYTGYFTAVDSDGNPKDPYELASTEDWNRLAAYVKAGNGCSGKTFKMTDDFEAGEMIGTSEHPFRGEFDGQSYILTVEYGSESKPFNEDYCAPFRYTGPGAKVKNLVLAGDIYTSKQYAAGVIGNANDNTTLDNVLCTVNIHSTVNGAGYHGGLVARVNASYTSWGTTILGCSFQGSLLGSNTTTVGGFVGYKGSDPYVTIYDSFFAPKEITVSGTNSFTFCGGNVTIGDATFFTTALGTSTQGKKALKITDESESVYYQGDYQAYNTSEMIFFTKDNNHKGYAMQAFVVDEIDDGDMEGEPTFFSAQGNTVYISSTANNLAVKDADGTAVTLTADDENGKYHFTMPAKDVTITGGGTVAYAIWCEGNKTLYFDYSDQKKSMGGNYQEQIITAVWSGNDVLSTGWSTPAWSSMASGATTVVFTEAFANAKPTSMNRWFWNFKNLATITGLANLNTSEVTVMNSTFYDCDALTSIDVNSFNVGKVNNASAMFGSCDNLVTIYCDKTWNIATTQNMFGGSTKLKSHNLSYNPNKTNGDMANPYTGYFTPSNLQIELANDADNSSATTKYAGIEVAKVTLTGRTFYHDGKWNTLCLPFNVASFTGTPLAGATVREIDVEGTYSGKKTGFDAENGTLYLYFKEEAVTSIVAHKPYIVMWNDGTDNNVTNPEFTSVTIVSGSASSVNSEDGKVSFVGTYGYQEFNSEDHSILLLGGDNSLYYPKANASIGAQRAFFQLHDITAGTPTSSVRSFVMNIDDSDATGLKELDNWTISPLDNSNGNEAWYSLDGRKLGSKPTLKGVYIHEGRKVVVP